jgi:hypothetical protein
VTPTLHHTLDRLAVRLTSSNGVGARVTAAPGSLASGGARKEASAVRGAYRQRKTIPATSTLAGAK